MIANSKFRVALTGDFYDVQGQLKFRDIPLALQHSAPDIELGRPIVQAAEIPPEQLRNLHGAINTTNVQPILALHLD